MARIRRYMGRVELWFDSRERAALRHAVAELARTPEPAAPDGGTLLRRRAYDDPELEAEYQRYTAPDVNAVVRAEVEVIRAGLEEHREPLRLDDDQALTWLRGLNRLRLVAGDRLGIVDDGWEEGAPEDLARDERWAMLLDLGWVQEGILAALE